MITPLCSRQNNNIDKQQWVDYNDCIIKMANVTCHHTYSELSHFHTTDTLMVTDAVWITCWEETVSSKILPVAVP